MSFLRPVVSAVIEEQRGPDGVCHVIAVCLESDFAARDWRNREPAETFAHVLTALDALCPCKGLHVDIASGLSVVTPPPPEWGEQPDEVVIQGKVWKMVHP